MRRLRLRGLTALVVVLPLWCICLLLHLGLVMNGELGWLPVIAQAPGAGSSPVVSAFWPEAGMRGTLAVNVAFILTAMIVVARTYLQADKYGRRQVKWVGLGPYLGTVPVPAAAASAGVDPSLWWLYEASVIATLAIPVCVF
ncbi:MAG: hypothetical protein P8R42_01770 [Candidatus Binatia bacterium]|nr:hypothetical protein [Candidatus Binatia bacterium]